MRLAARLTCAQVQCTRQCPMSLHAAGIPGALLSMLLSYTGALLSSVLPDPYLLPAAGCPNDSAALRAALASSGLLLQPLGAPALHLVVPQVLVTVVDSFSGAGLANLTIQGLQVALSSHTPLLACLFNLMLLLCCPLMLSELKSRCIATATWCQNTV